MRYAAMTDLGLVRQNNEDAVFAKDSAVGPLNNLFIVSDGMGGHLGGEYASSFVVSKIPELLSKKRRKMSVKALLSLVTDRCNKALYQVSQDTDDLHGMGATLVLATLLNGGLHVINVGDSRLYRMHAGSFRPVTRDHSMVEEMVEKGQISRDDPFYEANKNVITRAMGIDPYVEEDYFFLEPAAGDRLLLCSDGLSGMVPDGLMEELLREEENTELAVQRLMYLAKAAGGRDNISMILIDLEEADLDTKPADREDRGETE